LVISFISCTKSPLSGQRITEISKLKVHIKIQQSPFLQDSNQIILRLFDVKDKQIENDKIKIKVNNKELPLQVRRDLYYAKTVSYEIKNIPVIDYYYFEIVLSDNKTYPLAFIKMAEPILNENIIIDKEVALNEETIIQWKDLKEFTRLTIWKNYKDNNKESYGGGPYAESTINEIIETTENKYIVPRSYYKDSTTTATFLNVEFAAIKEGLINPYLLKGSSIQLTSKVDRTIKINNE